MSKKQLSVMECSNRKQLEGLFLSTISGLSYTRRRVEVFRDFVHMASCALRNSVPFAFSQDVEGEYMKVIGKYSKEKGEPDKIAELMAITVQALEMECSDFLGHIYMSQEMGNECAGQFFTPTSIAKAMAKMTLGDMKQVVEQSESGYITINDPACGGAVTLIEAVAEAKEQGINHSTELCIYAEDIDTVCVHMSYVQLALLGVPAIVSNRNTISMETWAQWRTPVWVLNGFDLRERRRMQRIENTDKKQIQDVTEIKPVETLDKPFTVDFKEARQLELFAV